MRLAHQIALNPNHVPETYFPARFADNWACAEWQRQDAAWQADDTLSNPSDAALRRQLNVLKHEQFPWMSDVTKIAPQMAIIHMGQAFKNFLAGIAEYPPFKQKGQHDSFTLTHDQLTMGRKVRIPKLGWVRMHEPLRLTGKAREGTVSRTAARWFLSVTVEIPDPSCVHRENPAVVGVDRGVSALATLSTGEKIIGQNAYATAQATLQPPHGSGETFRKGCASRGRRIWPKLHVALRDSRPGWRRPARTSCIR
jgi:putative transposase